VGHPSYVSFWRTIEKDLKYSERIKLHAFLFSLYDLTTDSTKLTMSISDYYKKAFEGVRNKIEEWQECSEKAEITISEFVNGLEIEI
jgi:hypothetical protein